MEPTVEVSIPVSLLEQVKDTLTSAYHYSQTEDLQETYRKQAKVVKESKLTTSLRASYEIVQGFIEIAANDEEQDGPSSDTQ